MTCFRRHLVLLPPNPSPCLSLNQSDSPSVLSKGTLSPSLLSLFCALLLCLPLAIVFTITSPAANTTPTIRDADENPVHVFLSKPKPPAPIRVPRDDESLFRVAAPVVNPKPTSPRKLALMFLTTAPFPFAPLWKLYFNGTSKSLYNIYIHADPTFLYDRPFTGVFAGRVIPSKPSRRNTPTLIAAARRLLAHALLDDPGTYMFAVLSPSCIPIHSFNFTHKTLMKSKESFIEILENEPGTYDRWAARGQDAMLPEVKLEDFRIGSQFWVLTRKHARLVVKDKRIGDMFNEPCTQPHTCYPD